MLTGALSVIAGDGIGLLHPSSNELLRASASAAHALAPADEHASDAAQPQRIKQSDAGLLQVLAPQPDERSIPRQPFDQSCYRY